MRTASFLGLCLFGSFAVAAKDEGCGGGSVSANVPDTRADGGPAGSYVGGPVSSTWPTPAIPDASEIEPMSCAWLAGDNCWKQLTAEVEACTGGADQAAPFSADRRSCDHADGARTEFAGPVDAPPSTFQIVDNRIVDRDHRPCFTSKIIGVGKVAVSSPNLSAVFESTSLTAFRVTCSDGHTYASDVAGVCPSFGGDYLAGTVPGSTIVCDAKTGLCTHELQGTTSGRKVISRCGP